MATDISIHKVLKIETERKFFPADEQCKKDFHTITMSIQTEKEIIVLHIFSDTELPKLKV